MRTLRVTAVTLLLTLVAGLGITTAEAAPSWSVRGSATSINSGVKHSGGEHLGTSAPTRRDATKHQLQMTWSGQQGIRVWVGWDITCWDIGQNGPVSVQSYANSVTPWMTKGTTWTRTWNQTRDACQVGIEAFNSVASQNSRAGVLTVKVRDLK